MGSGSLEIDIKAAELLLKQNDDRSAVRYLLDAIKKLNDREKRRAEYANRLIAENMFAIVRLEIAHGTDQIINNALAVKRDRTGSREAEFALNVTGTLVMLAGNVLSGGSMSLLGNLLVATGEMVKAAAKNDTEGLVTGVIHAGAATVESVTKEGQEDFKNQFVGNFFKQRSKDAETEGITGVSRAGIEGLLEVEKQFRTRFGRSDEEEKYKLEKKKTVWIKHGAGGTNAITWDVQESIKDAYAEVLGKINTELKQIETTRPNSNSSILGQIINKDMDADAKLHPVTRAVLKDALNRLSNSGGAKYEALTGGSGPFSRTPVLALAKQDVKKAYTVMHSKLDETGSVPEVAEVKAGIK